ncbi:MAG: hypothetical protein P9M14_00120 [Candidatus Alcyoniella australis]|nr:hypothetical protein [Candidatus Alcyoniella australis]
MRRYGLVVCFVLLCVVGLCAVPFLGCLDTSTPVDQSDDDVIDDDDNGDDDDGQMVWIAGKDWVGGRGVLLQREQDGWKRLDPLDPDGNWDLKQVAVGGANYAVAVGNLLSEYQGLIAYFNGEKWSSISPSSAPEKWSLNAVDIADDHVVAAGSDQENLASPVGLLLHYDGNSWHNRDLPQVGSEWELLDLDMLSNENGFAVGHSGRNGSRQGVILRWKDAEWIDYTLPDVSDDWELHAVSFAGTGAVWSVGVDNSGTVSRPVTLYKSEGPWQQVDVEDTRMELNGVNFISSSLGFICGESLGKGIVYRFNVGDWEKQDLPDVDGQWLLNDIAMVSQTEAYAVGKSVQDDQGIALYWNGAQWSQIDLPQISSNWEPLGIGVTH